MTDEERNEERWKLAQSITNTGGHGGSDVYRTPYTTKAELLDLITHAVFRGIKYGEQRMYNSMAGAGQERLPLWENIGGTPEKVM